ncbi:MAG: HAD family phosphatase [Lachnospiraceae bacterium]|nr:HAD family phosphatase [Lachnospiraceae bacterium]
MNIKAVIFDMDGVIFDSERCCLNIWKELAAAASLEDIETNFQKCIGTTVPVTKKILSDCYGDRIDPDAYMAESSRLFHERYDNGKLPLLPYAEEILSFLKESGYLLGLASSTREATVRLQLGNAGLLHYFDTVTCGDMLKKSKPEPDIYLMACAATGVEPKEAVAIEDSYNGIRSAHAAGMIPVMVPDLIPADEEMRALSYRIFPDLKAALDFFKELNPPR